MQAKGRPTGSSIPAFSVPEVHYRNGTQNHTRSGSYHYGLIFGILQRSPAFFSDRDLKWVGDGLEDLGDLGDLGDLKELGGYGVLIRKMTREGPEMQGQDRPGIKENPRNLHGIKQQNKIWAYNAGI